MVNGRSPISVVTTGTGTPEFGACVAGSPVAWMCCAFAARVRAAAPAPNPRTLRKKLLRGFISLLLFYVSNVQFYVSNVQRHVRMEDLGRSEEAKSCQTPHRDAGLAKGRVA